jgi:Na+-translocating ferredoxin:NAD+ oxidoreductase RnfG subunit
MTKIFVLIIYMSICFNSFGNKNIEFENKRLMSNLKKSGITDFSMLKEMDKISIDYDGLNGKFFKVENRGNGSDIEFVYVGRVNSCRTGGCEINDNAQLNTESEYFDYFIFFDSQKTVVLVEVFNYQATHGYEITAKGWLKQFVGFTGNDTLLVNKEIDGISGATISVYAITEDVQSKTRILNAL